MPPPNLVLQVAPIMATQRAPISDPYCVNALAALGNTSAHFRQQLHQQISSRHATEAQPVTNAIDEQKFQQLLMQHLNGQPLVGEIQQRAQQRHTASMRLIRKAAAECEGSTASSASSSGVGWSAESLLSSLLARDEDTLMELDGSPSGRNKPHYSAGEPQIRRQMQPEQQIQQQLPPTALEGFVDIQSGDAQGTEKGGRTLLAEETLRLLNSLKTKASWEDTFSLTAKALRQSSEPPAKLPGSTKGPSGVAAGSVRSDVTLGGNKPHYHVAKQEWRVRYYMSGKRKMRTYSAKFYGYEAAHTMARDFAAYVDTYEALPTGSYGNYNVTLGTPHTSGAGKFHDLPSSVQHIEQQLQQHQQLQPQGQSDGTHSARYSQARQEGTSSRSRGPSSGAGTTSLQVVGHSSSSSSANNSPALGIEPAPCSSGSASSGRGCSRKAEKVSYSSLWEYEGGPPPCPGRPAPTVSRSEVQLQLQLQVLLQRRALAESSATCHRGASGKASSGIVPVANERGGAYRETPGPTPFDRSVPTAGDEPHAKRHNSGNSRCNTTVSKRSAATPYETSSRIVQSGDTETSQFLETFLTEFAREKVACLQAQHCRKGHSKDSSLKHEKNGQEALDSEITNWDDPAAILERLTAPCTVSDTEEILADLALEQQQVEARHMHTGTCPNLDMLSAKGVVGKQFLEGRQSIDRQSSITSSDLLTFSRIVVELTSHTYFLLHELKAAIGRALVLLNRSPLHPPPAPERPDIPKLVDTIPCKPTTTLEAPEDVSRESSAVDHAPKSTSEVPRQPEKHRVAEGTSRQEDKREETLRCALELLRRHQELGAAIMKLQLPIPSYLERLVLATGPFLLPVKLPRNGQTSSQDEFASNAFVVIQDVPALKALVLRPFDASPCSCKERPCLCDQQHMTDMLCILSTILSRGDFELKSASAAASPQQSALKQHPFAFLAALLPMIAGMGQLPTSSRTSTEANMSKISVQVDHAGAGNGQPGGTSSSKSSPALTPSATTASSTGSSPLSSPPEAGKPSRSSCNIAESEGEVPAAGSAPIVPRSEPGRLYLPPMIDTAHRNASSKLTCGNTSSTDTSLLHSLQLLQQHADKPGAPTLPYEQMLSLVAPLQSLLHTLSRMILHLHKTLVARYITSTFPSSTAEILVREHLDGNKPVTSDSLAAALLILSDEGNSNCGTSAPKSNVTSPVDTHTVCSAGAAAAAGAAAVAAAAGATAAASVLGVTLPATEST